MVVGAALLVAAIYWFLPKKLGGARHFFTGPVRPDDEDEEFKDVKLCRVNPSEAEFMGSSPDREGEALE